MEKERVNIRFIRENLGITRQQIVKEIGVPYRTLQNWELGTKFPPKYVYNLMIIAIYKMGERNAIKQSRAKDTETSERRKNA